MKQESPCFSYGECQTCLTSDFFIEEADEWRNDVWNMIKERVDCHFFIITKRIHRFLECIPCDWGLGYDNVTIACTVENQTQAETYKIDFTFKQTGANFVKQNKTYKIERINQIGQAKRANINTRYKESVYRNEEII